MGGLKFETLQKLVFSYYGKCKYEKALDIARIAAEGFPEKLSRTSYWRACLYSLLGRNKEAIEVLRSALAKGIWWSPEAMLLDEDLDGIKGTKAFEDILEGCRYYEEKARKSSKPEVLIITPNQYTEGSSYPLLFAIHWHNGNPQDFSRLWRYNSAFSNFILAFPQSSQVTGVNEYCWDDEATSRSDIQELYSSVVKGYPIDTGSIIFAGASQGGKLALDMALKYNADTVKGFIVFIPALREFESYIPYLRQAAAKKLRGCIITGDQDYYYVNVLTLNNCFRRFGLSCKLIAVPGMGHFFPDDYEKKIKLAVDYIMNG